MDAESFFLFGKKIFYYPSSYALLYLNLFYVCYDLLNSSCNSCEMEYILSDTLISKLKSNVESYNNNNKTIH